MKEIETSAGILLYRRNIITKELEVMLVSSYSDPKKLMKKVWNIPKGHVEKGQSLAQTAIRQFEEQTGIHLDQNQKQNLDYIGLCCTKAGKHVHIFGLEKDVNGGKQNVNIKSMMIDVQQPPGSGNFIKIPQVCRGKYFNIKKAYNSIFNYQSSILTRLETKIQ